MSAAPHGVASASATCLPNAVAADGNFEKPFTCNQVIEVNGTDAALDAAIPGAIQVWNVLLNNGQLPRFVPPNAPHGPTVTVKRSNPVGTGPHFCGSTNGLVITIYRNTDPTKCGPPNEISTNPVAESQMSTLIAHELGHALGFPKHLSQNGSPAASAHCVASLPPGGGLNGSLCQVEMLTVKYYYGMFDSYVSPSTYISQGVTLDGVATANPGESKLFEATGNWDGAGPTGVRWAWSSSDVSVAKPSLGGGGTNLIQAIAPGTATISARLLPASNYLLLSEDSDTRVFTVNGGAPPPPTGVNVTGITPNSATVRWTNGTSNVASVVEIRLQGASTWTPTPATAVGATSRLMTGLSAQTAYQVRVKHVSGTQSSAFTSPVSFTTAAMLPPTGLNVTSITSNSATARWTNGSSNVSTVVEIRLSGATNWTTTPPTAVGATSRLMSGLSSQTGYQIRAKHVDAVNTSAYTSIVSFTTAAIASPTITNFRVAGCEQRPSGAKTYNYFDLAWNASPAQDQGSYQVAMHHTNTVSLATVILTVPGTQTSGEVGGYLNSGQLMNRWFWVRYVRNGTPATPWVALNPSPLATNQCLL